jgi:dihydroxyacetone kinase
MAQFINDKDDLVKEAIDGVVACSGGALARLDGYPHIKVVHRADWDRSKVALISGGGSGHEPAHAGFVGAGMLTAAVCGEVFASPSVDAVLAGILAVTGDAGCLLIVKNYTGDRLNFGLAAERARARGHKVEMVVVDDDIALPELPQPRGVAGTLFLHKIAGAMAEAGKSLSDIADVVRSATKNMASIGTSLDTCTVPGSAKEDRIPLGKAELGLGIHGEPGVEQVDFVGASSAMNLVLDKLAPKIGDQPHVAILNNLGSTTPLEMSVLSNELVSSTKAKNVEYLIGPSAMMTSLDMHGFSVSVLPVDDEIAALLAEPVGCAAWPGMARLSDISIISLPDGLSPIKALPSKDPDTKALLEKCCDVLIASEDDLNALDAKSGDGDTGSTLATAARALIRGVDELPLADAAQLFRALSQELSQTMGGSSGVILGIFFGASGDACANGKTVPIALLAGLERICQVGGASVGDRTMIDALDPALRALDECIKKAATAARVGADATAQMSKAKAGRAAYVPEENLIGHKDPGAEAVARLFAAMENAV